MSGRDDVGRWEPSAAQRGLRDDAARAFGIEPLAVIGRSRKRPIVRARHAATWVLKTRWPALSWPQVSAMLGGRDHSTAINAWKMAEIFRERDADYRAVTDALASNRHVAKMPALRIPPPPKPLGCRVTDAMGARTVRARNDFAEDDCDGRSRARGTLKLSDALAKAGFGMPNR